MKEIKKESLKIFAKSNLKNLILILFIRIFINFLLFFLVSLTAYSFSNQMLPSKSIFYSFLSPISVAKNLDYLPLRPILIFTLFYATIMFIPLKMGIYLWFSKIKKDNKTSLLIIFHYYKNLKLFIKSISFEFIIFFNSIFNFILCFVPTVGTFIFVCLKTYDLSTEFQILIRILILFSAITILIGMLFFFKMQISHTAAKFIFVQNGPENIFSIIKISNFLIHNNSKEFKKFLLSFWTSLILSFFVIPIPFVIAYFHVCMLEFTKKITYKQNQGISAIPLTQKVVDINL